MFQDVDPALIEPHVSNRVFWPIIPLLSEDHGRGTVEKWVSDAGLDPRWFDDKERWVSYHFLHRFEACYLHDARGLDTQPPVDHPAWRPWRILGRRSLTRESAGLIFPIITSLGTVEQFYRRVPALTRHANKLTTTRVLELSQGLAVLEADAHYPESPAGCQLRQGLFEQAPAVWGRPLARVEHPQCRHRGDPTCVYQIHFQPTAKRRLLVGIGPTVVAILVLAWAARAAGVPEWEWVGVLTGLLFALIGMTRRAFRAEAGRVKDSTDLREILGKAEDQHRVLWEESRELRRALLTNRKIAGFLANDLVEQIMEDPEREVELGGTTTHAAVLFADIVGFTARCEEMPASQVVKDLNAWFAVADPIIAAHDGIIDKRIGDSIMVVFVTREGTDQRSVDRRAIQCGLALLEAVVPCSELLVKAGSKPLALRVGAAAGRLVLGNMGSPLKLEYTVIGDVVNQAARLEGAGRPGELCVPAEVLARAGDRELEGLVREHRSLQVKGREAPLDVVTLMPPGQAIG